MPITDSFDEIFKQKNRILVVMPHPDDAELYCGGTIARLVVEGKCVRIIKVTSGDRGSRQENISAKKLREIREQEDRRAMKILGIAEEDNIYLGIGDGEIENDLQTIGKIVYQIRQFKPDLIITTNPEDMIIRFDKNVNWVNHRDHRNCGKSVIDAAYPYARDLLFFPEHLKEEGIDSHKTVEFLLTDYYSHPDLIYIEVTKNIDVRIRAHAAHSSQYSMTDARESADFFTKSKSSGSKCFERFRYVLID